MDPTTCSILLVSRFKTRSSSPPPPTSLSVYDSSDELDECNSLTEVQRVTNKKSPTSPSKSIILPGPELKKSQSVKLTNISLADSSPKKAVRFADDFGLALDQIRLIKTDELPRVPSGAFKDLQIYDYENSFNSERSKVISYMQPQFENPIHAIDFHNRLSQQKILLEQANAIDNRIYGTVKLISYGLHKRVKIRLTADNWLSSKEYDASYISNSYDSTYDRFSFTVDIERQRICAGNNIQFCLCYEPFGGSQYWDNNYQQNYRFDCLSRIIPDFTS
ncbi:unnamed protein product [Adineta ricciae]|uniref:CBM21 domain-containing protein n=1 Tax=Adineta ricciae TaxID=249248 RepID=A0A813X5A8_ADIRI|nr:unnamed protein product [Adineta ricciae]CAF1074599.1 unnamed protein product [Adineta ricciae]